MMMFQPQQELKKRGQIKTPMNPILSLTLQADLRYVRVASLTACNVAKIFADFNCDAADISEFCHAYELAVSEAFTNSVRHAQPSQPETQVTVRISSEHRTLAVCIIDANPPFNPVTQAPDINSYPEGGYGLFLIHQLMDTVYYARENNTNTLTMIKQAKMTYTENTWTINPG